MVIIIITNYDNNNEIMVATLILRTYLSQGMVKAPPKKYYHLGFSPARQK